MVCGNWFGRCIYSLHKPILQKKLYQCETHSGFVFFSLTWTSNTLSLNSYLQEFIWIENDIIKNKEMNKNKQKIREWKYFLSVLLYILFKIEN